MHYELPISAFIATTLVLLPLPWHWRAKNIPTLSIIAWLFMTNLIYAVNSIIWIDNVLVTAVVWCDIATKIQMGSTMALPACCLCLCIHLERISSARQVTTSHSDRRRRMIFDGIMCWVVPMIYMALHYIVQGHRFDIVEFFGCRPAVFNSVQSILIIWVPPLIAVALTIVFAGLSLHNFFQRRLTFARHLQASNSALTASRYFRLMAMAVVQMFWGALVISFHMWFTVSAGLRPWISWADVHSNFSRVGQFPAIMIPPSVLQTTFFTWWTNPVSAVLFFIFFAFGQDAMKEYGACVDWVCSIFRRKRSSKVHLRDISKPISKSLPPHDSLPTCSTYTSDSATKSQFADDSTLANDHDDRKYLEKTSSLATTPTSPTSFMSSDQTMTPFPDISTFPSLRYSHSNDGHSMA